MAQGFFGVLIFAPIRSSLSLEICITPPPLHLPPHLGTWYANKTSVWVIYTISSQNVQITTVDEKVICSNTSVVFVLMTVAFLTPLNFILGNLRSEKCKISVEKWKQNKKTKTKSKNINKFTRIVDVLLQLSVMYHLAMFRFLGGSPHTAHRLLFIHHLIYQFQTLAIGQNNLKTHNLKLCHNFN